MASVTRARRPSNVVLSDRRARIQTSPYRHLDLLLVATTIAIALLGLLMIYSGTRTRLEAAGDDPFTFVKRQAVWIGLGVAAMFVVLAIDYRKLREWALAGYGATVLVLVVVLTSIGTNAKGSQSRFELASFQFQPAEYAKFFLILMLAAYCAMHRGDLGPRRAVFALGIAGVPLALVMLQPDLGTGLVLGAITLGILAAGGLKGRYIAALAAIGCIAAVGAIELGALESYQVDRLTAFVDQSGDGRESTYNLEQSKAAIGSGGLTGKGLFEGTQTKGGFVPEQHTDFIFTVVGEELGFAGAATLLALFAILVWRTWRAALLSRDFFGTLVCIGVLAMLVFQIFENAGMTMGIMPITGLPLPLLSYGGSSVIVTFMCVGLVANVHMRRFA